MRNLAEAGTLVGVPGTAETMATPSATLVPFPKPAEAIGRDRLAATWLPVVLEWCRRLGGPRVDAEDAAHDVMLTLLARHDQLRDPAALRAFVFGITRRTLAAHGRRAWVRRWVGALSFEPVSERADAFDHVHDRELAGRVAEALEALSVDHRELIVLVEVEGRSLQEAAELLDVPLGTVKSRLSRARVAFAAAALAAGLEGS